MRILNIPGLEQALTLAFGFTNFAAFTSVATRGPIHYSSTAVRVGRFVLETELSWGDTLEQFIICVVALRPQVANIGGRKAVALYRGTTQVMTIVEDPAP